MYEVAREIAEGKAKARELLEKQAHAAERSSVSFPSGEGTITSDTRKVPTEERNQLYRMLRINVRVHVDGTMDIGGALRVCNSDSIA